MGTGALEAPERSFDMEPLSYWKSVIEDLRETAEAYPDTVEWQKALQKCQNKVADLEALVFERRRLIIGATK